MLLNFKIKNFRSIKDEVVLDLQATSDKAMKESSLIEDSNVSLLKSVAIYGSNASGKSNIMKAFVAFRVMVLESLLRGNTTSSLPSEIFKLNTDMEKKPSFFEMTFLIQNEVYSYGFEMTKQVISKEWLKQKKGNKTLFERNEQEIKTNKNYFKESSEVLKKQTSERVLFLSVLSSNNAPLSKEIVQFVQKINYISGTNRGNTMDFAFKKFLDDPQMAKQMKKFIVEADFGIVDIKASEKYILAKDVQNMPDKFKELFFKEGSKVAERSLKFLHKKFNKNKEEIEKESLDFFSEESEGTQQMFALSAPILDTLENGKILFIDEIDASLHPILCQYLISIFNSKEKNPNNAQLVFTTHDVSLLRDDLLRRDQIYFTEKNKFGETELFSLSDIKERKGLDFAKRYLEGRYNAIPYISDYENLKFNK